MRRPYCYNTLIALLLIAIGWAAYGFSLRLPLFSDDIPHFRWMEGQTWLGILTGRRVLPPPAVSDLETPAVPSGWLPCSDPPRG